MEKNDYRVVIVNYTFEEVLNYAAEELKKYLYLTTGVNAKICSLPQTGTDDFCFIFNSNMCDDEIKSDGFRIKGNGKSVEISANIPRAILYGVYEYLECFLGVRFFAPNCERLPHSDFHLPVCNYVSNPAFPMRATYNAATRLDKAFYAKQRNHNQFEVVEKKYGGNCGWERVNGQTGHNTLQYVSPSIYGKEHPEMFAWHGGNITDICFTNGINDKGDVGEETLSCVTVITDYIKKRISEDANLRYFMVGQTDSWIGNENECDCKRCQEAKKLYKSSGILVRFLNAVARETAQYIKKDYPGRKVFIVGFAYSQTFEAPVKKEYEKMIPIDETVIPDANVIIWLCATGQMNKRYSFLDLQHNSKDSENCLAWLELSKKIMVWEYAVNYSEYFWYFPSLNGQIKSVRDASRYDCEYMLSLLGYADINEWQSLYKGYILSKLMWDPTLNETEIFREYLNGYYGDGSVFVEEMINLFEKNADEIEKKIAGQNAFFYITKSDDYLFNAEYYPNSLLEKAENLLDAAEEAIKNRGINTEILLKRIDCVRLTPMLMRLYNFYYYNKNIDDIFPFFKKIKDICKKCDIKNYSEGLKIEDLQWQIDLLMDLRNHKIAAWDIYRYLYDGFVGGYYLPKR